MASSVVTLSSVRFALLILISTSSFFVSIHVIGPIKRKERTGEKGFRLGIVCHRRKTQVAVSLSFVLMSPPTTDSPDIILHHNRVDNVCSSCCLLRYKDGIGDGRRHGSVVHLGVSIPIPMRHFQILSFRALLLLYSLPNTHRKRDSTYFDRIVTHYRY